MKTIIKFSKSTPVGSAQYVSGDIAGFKPDVAKRIVDQKFAIYWDPKAGKPADKAESAAALPAGADQVRREEAKAKGSSKQPERK